MRLSRHEFDARMAENKLTLTFIGMSGIGKTHRARQFVPLGFRHRSCDDVIASRVSGTASLGNVTDVGVWMGQPNREGYGDRERQYLNLENTAAKDILDSVDGNTVIDTTGSIIYVSKDTQRRLKKDSLVVYFEASPEVHERMLEVYLDDPKPVGWRTFVRGYQRAVGKRPTAQKFAGAEFFDLYARQGAQIWRNLDGFARSDPESYGYRTASAEGCKDYCRSRLRHERCHRRTHLGHAKCGGKG